MVLATRLVVATMCRDKGFDYGVLHRQPGCAARPAGAAGVAAKWLARRFDGLDRRNDRLAARRRRAGGCEIARSTADRLDCGGDHVPDAADRAVQWDGGCEPGAGDHRGTVFV